MKYLLMILAMASTAAPASTPAAWADHDAAVRTACAKASDLATPVLSTPVIFSDGGGAKTAVLVSGRYRQPFMRGARGTMLCLYDRRLKRAEVSEAKGWSARP